ncbi:hypothetical protein [Lentzea nigeriaca]|uniref:hypothetical protein n=1 Tax=Lentzea nigeriaca TaxID=1128665 RepID=UPI00195A2735|nr:hypothetical protein [Lentzea nigeriaca]MBM7860472.1 hypothetical protein [Lentzea nigeriaca]
MEKLSSRSLALALATGYLVVSVLIGAAMVAAQKEEPRALNDPTYDYTTTTKRTTATTTTQPVRRTTTTTTRAIDYQRVSGAYELVTAIPEGWSTRTGDVSTVQVARSAAMPGFEMRFGGAPPDDPSKSMLGRITAAHQAKLGKNSYEVEELTDTKFHGYPSVVWSYTTTPNGTRQYCTGVWWEAGGIEYVLFVVSPPSERTQAESLLNLMTTHAKP